MKFYQYLRGENEGKVVTLNYVDDSDSSFILYHFSDGFKCNQDFIADINDFNAYNSGKILAEVPNENMLWTFNKKTINMEHKKAIGQNGETYEGADPYFFDKKGQQLHQNIEKVNVKPPTRFYGKVEPIETYLKSFKDYQLSLLKTSSSQDDEEIEKTSLSSEKNTETSKPKEVLTTTTTTTEAPQNSSLIKNSVVDVLMQSAKLNEANVSFNVLVNLPDKSLIELINKNYPPSYIDEAFNYIIEKLDVSDIKTAIKDTLKDFYFSDNESINKNEEDK